MFKKILIASDGSVLATIAARNGIEMAAKLGAEVVGVYVSRKFEDPGFFAPKTGPAQTAYDNSAKKKAAEVLIPIEIAAVKAALQFTAVHCVNNHPASAIVHTAEEHACDLIFIGSNGCAGWDNILMGSNSSKVLATAKIPVLAYRVRENDLPAHTPHYSDALFPPA